MKAKCISAAYIRDRVTEGLTYTVRKNALFPNDYDVWELGTGAYIGQFNSIRFELLTEENVPPTLRSCNDAQQVQVKDKETQTEASFFRPVEDAWTCKSCGSPKPCSYHQ